MVLILISLLIAGAAFFLVDGIVAVKEESKDKAIRMRFQNEAYDERDIISLPAYVQAIIAPFNLLNNLILTRFKAINEGLTDQFKAMGVYLHVVDFLSLSEFLGLSLLLVYVIVVGPKKVNAGISIVILAAGSLLLYYWIRKRYLARQRAVLKLLPDVVDFLSLCVSAGLDLIGSMQRVITEFDKKEPLIQELSYALQEINMGKARHDALTRMSERIRLPDISSWVRSMVQADRMGTSLLTILQIYSQTIRQRRFTMIERAAIKAPLKLLLPLVIIMFVVLVIVGGPVILQFVRQNPLKGAL